mmetsp:Transcript_5964/g.13251  ORF Transcript_5964/g.13251 Transcript_5964/m.13251 type:complete len:209 (-) Transcript_5964:1169-1795(-)
MNFSVHHHNRILPLLLSSTSAIPSHGPDLHPANHLLHYATEPQSPPPFHRSTETHCSQIDLLHHLHLYQLPTAPTLPSCHHTQTHAHDLHCIPSTDHPTHCFQAHQSPLCDHPQTETNRLPLHPWPPHLQSDFPTFANHHLHSTHKSSHSLHPHHHPLPVVHLLELPQRPMSIHHHSTQPTNLPDLQYWCQISFHPSGHMRHCQIDER